MKRANPTDGFMGNKSAFFPTFLEFGKSQFGICFYDDTRGGGESTAKEFYVARIKTQKDQKNIS